MTEKTIAMCAIVRRMMELEEQKRETLSKLLVTIAAKDQRDAIGDGSLGTMDEWENLREDVLVLAGLRKDKRFGYFNRSSLRLKDRLERLERVQSR